MKKWFFLLVFVLAGAIPQVGWAEGAAAYMQALTESGKQKLLFSFEKEKMVVALRMGADVDTVLKEKSEKRCEECAAFEVKAPLLFKGSVGRTVLQVALETAASKDVVLWLLDKGADPNKFFPGARPLYLSVTKYDSEVTKRLIEAGADVNNGDSGFRSGLNTAIEKGNASHVHVIAQHVDFSKRMDLEDESPLERAIAVADSHYRERPDSQTGVRAGPPSEQDGYVKSMRFLLEKMPVDSVNRVLPKNGVNNYCAALSRLAYRIEGFRQIVVDFNLPSVSPDCFQRFK